MRRLAALLLLPALAAAAGPDALLREAAAAYRAGRLLDALERAARALEEEPDNAVAKNYVWTITQDLRKKRPRLKPGEAEAAAARARKYLEDRRRRTEEALADLREASRKTGDFRSPTGVLAALGELGQAVGPGLPSGEAGTQGQVYMGHVLGNLQAALEKNVFVTRKDHLRAEGYLAYYKREWSRAVELWEKALAEDPSDGQIRNDLDSLKALLARERERDALEELVSQAETYQETGLHQQAAEAWREVLRRDPKRPGAAEGLAASRVALEKTRQLKTLEAMNEEAVALYRQGKSMGAAEIWLEALQLDPTYQKARVWLKLVGKRLKGYEEPEEPASAAPAAAPAVPAADAARAAQLYKKGLMAYAEGRLEEANQLWRRALEADPSLRKAQEALKQGEAELSLGRR